MVKRLNGRGSKFKKISAVLALAAFLSPLQTVYASNSPKKEKAPLSIILGARKGFGESGLYGGEFGMKFGRFALVGNLGSAPDINLQKTEENVFGDVYFLGEEYLKDSSSFGGSLEYHQPLGKGVSGVIGAGVGLESLTRNIEENLVRRTGSEESLLASNINSIPEKEVFGNVYGGLNFKIAKGLSLNPNIGYKTGLRKGMFVNLRAIFSFPGKGKK